MFLREYAMVDGKPIATGHMLEGANGGPPTWADVKAAGGAQMLGIELTDADVLRVPAVLTDLYGEFVRGANGLPQLVTADGLGRRQSRRARRGRPGGTRPAAPSSTTSRTRPCRRRPWSTMTATRRRRRSR